MNKETFLHLLNHRLEIIVVKLIFGIILALIFLFFLHFSFIFIGSLGNSLLSHIIGFEIDLFLG